MVSMGLTAAALTATRSSRERGDDTGRDSMCATLRGSPRRSTGTSTARVCEGTVPLWPPLLLQVPMARERCCTAIAVVMALLRLPIRTNVALAAATGPAGRATQRSMTAGWRELNARVVRLGWGG